MRRIVTGLFTSLDGVVDADDEWQFPYFDEELFAGIAAGWERAGALLLGRRSYEGYARLRAEHPDSPVLAFMDATPTYVVSTTLQPGAHERVTIIDRALRERIEQMRSAADGDVLVLGSPSLVRWLLADGLLDELNLTILPILVGSGAKLFDAMPVRRLPLQLAESKALASGALELRYLPARS